MTADSPLDDVNRFTKLFHGIAQQHLSNDHDIEDAGQATWLAVLQKASGLVRRIDLWSFGVAHNVARCTWRREKRHRERLAEYGERMRRLSANAPDVRLDASLVRHVAGQLPPPYREVIDLHYLQELSVDEVAEQLGRPKNTVKSQVRRGIALIRADLEQRCGQKLPPTGAWAWLYWLGRRQLHWLLRACMLVALPLAGVWLWLLPGPAAASPFGRTAAVATAPTADAAAGRLVLARRVPVASPDPDGSLLVRAVSTATGKPVGHLAVTLERPSKGATASRGHRTTADGELTLSSLAPGSYRLTPARGEPLWADVRPGHRTAVQLRIPEGRRVRGRALRQHSDEPLAGAAILLSWPGRIDRWSEVARCDDDGRFDLAQLDPACWLSVRPHRGRTGSWILLRTLLDRGGSEGITVRTGVGLGALRGTVLRADGQPCTEGRVALFVRQREPQLKKDLWVTRPPELSTTTGESGDFAIERQTAWADVLLVTAPGHAPLIATLTPEHRTLPPLRLQLPVVLSGTAHDPSGSPLAGATVSVEPEWPLPEVLLTTDDDGHFETDRIGVGKFTVRAWDPQGRSAVWHDAAPDSPLELTLSNRDTIRGRAIGGDGRPLAGWPVELATESVVRGQGDVRGLYAIDDTRRTVTDRHGTFAFPARDRVDHRLRLFRPGTPDTLPRTQRDGVRPGDGLVLLTTDRGSMPSASLEGSIAAYTPGCRVGLRSQVQAAQIAAGPHGEFAFEGLPAGTYEIVLWQRGEVPVVLTSCSLAPFQRLRLDRLTLPEPGSITLQVSGLGDRRPAGLKGILNSAAQRRRHRFPPGESSTRFDSVAPGDYWVWVTAGVSILAFDRVHVAAGADVHHVIPVREGRRVRITVDWADPREAAARLWFVRREDGERRDFGLMPSPRGPERPQVALPFSAGTWDAFASCEDGRQGRSSFVIDRVDGERLACTVTLRYEPGP